VGAFPRGHQRKPSFLGPIIGTLWKTSLPIEHPPSPGFGTASERRRI
jgi:hypothetical protein